jgi:hypothetical protein
MSDIDPSDELRDAAREALRELLPDLLEGALRSDAPGRRSDGHSAHVHASNGHAPGGPAVNGSAPVDPAVSAAEAQDVAPAVPAPPVAAVLRPSTWSGPPVPGEVIGGRGGQGAPVLDGTPNPGGAAARPPATASPNATVETVTIDDDEDLEAFVRALAARLENPRDRLAIRAGKLRFTLGRACRPAPAGGASGGDVLRIEKGAVTERVVSEAATRGATVVLSRRAVLTPLARDKGRALGVRIEREG